MTRRTNQHVSQLLPSTDGQDPRHYQCQNTAPFECTTDADHDGGIHLWTVYDRKLRPPQILDSWEYRHVYFSGVSEIQLPDASSC